MTDVANEGLIAWSGALLQGALVTVEMTFAAYAIALVIGLIGAAAKLGGPKPVAGLATTYTTVIRAVPELLLIILLYYSGQQLLNALLRDWGYATFDLSGFATAIGVLAVVEGAYLTEIFRGAILAIPSGHIEAADAYGMSRRMRFRRIILPEMLPQALPSMYNIFLLLVKDTALVSVVGFNELFFTAQQAAASTRAYFLFYAATGVIYLIMTMGSNVVFRWLERRVTRHRAAT